MRVPRSSPTLERGLSAPPVRLSTHSTKEIWARRPIQAICWLEWDAMLASAPLTRHTGNLGAPSFALPRRVGVTVTVSSASLLLTCRLATANSLTRQLANPLTR